MQSEKWNALVIPAVHGLVKTTLPMLSAGWGISLGLVFAAAVPASFSYVNLYLWWGGVYSVVMAVAIPLVALLVAADVAAASSKCSAGRPKHVVHETMASVQTLAPRKIFNMRWRVC